jgi:2-isopropylmalate synthase
VTTRPYFEVCGYKVISERMHEPSSRSQAIVEISFGGPCVRRSAVGVGPVHALDNALRSCLGAEYSELDRVRLSDYTVSVVDASDGTGAEVRVVVEATDGVESWHASCVSENIIDASFEALCATAVVGIARARESASFTRVAVTA